MGNRSRMSEISERFARQARNEAQFREVNERIAELGEPAGDSETDNTLDLLCECGTAGGCGERVRMPLAAYEQVRAQDDRFVVRPGHETPELEYAVDWTDQYVIVDKVAAAEWLVEDDPRGAPST
jgi:hypothetical protein